MQEGGTTGSRTPPNPSHPVSAAATDAQELPAVPMRDTNTQPKKNHLRSLKRLLEMICSAVEALCCAQTLIECCRDRLCRFNQPDDEYLVLFMIEVANEKVFVFVCESDSCLPWKLFS